MHKVADTITAIGAILLLLGAVAVWMGVSIDDGITPDSEDWSGTLMWEGTTPATFEGEFSGFSTYYVWVKKSGIYDEEFDVSVEVLNATAMYFVSCEKWDGEEWDEPCKAIPGYEYIGEIYLEDMFDAGTYEVQFTDENGGEAAVMIREDSDGGGFFVLMGGLFGCFVGILLLVVGGFLSFFTKENKSTYIEPIIPPPPPPPINSEEDQEKAVETPDKPWWQDDKIE
ncbi:MAG TPA: hypothetical protein EYQ15_05160 [Candidatus Poseidoniales archaeon]|nr:hypothetical protein [Candidatus Poseidoniales archaeon]